MHFCFHPGRVIGEETDIKKETEFAVCKKASTSTFRDPRLHAPDGCTIYSNVWPGNGWENSVETHAEFVASLDLPNHLALSPNFRNWMVHADLLHVLYRGVLPQFVGSIIILLAQDNFWHQKGVAENLQTAYRLCNDYLKQRGCRISLDEFKADAFKGEHGYAELPGKGSDSKLISFWVLTQVAKYWNRNSQDQLARVLHA